ncbi:PREDICTED: uncharacterized protein LOC104811875 [Tarenaya hassleriana]|uniref:uncharacterized protein LOC104811875 n=1 Tax=Tarenaya hassleriana TaxID=28532 RepID=UPI00053C7D30|nr:PREDICTED: uncharacterized protein LOC104811875 [Tarenaya hassleriana]
MSACNFFKHLPCISYQTFSRHFLKPQRFSSSSTPRSLFSVSASSSSSSSSSSSFAANAEPFTAPYLSVRIHCPKHVADPFSEALLCFGASSVSVDEEDDIAAPGSCVGSDEIRIDSIFPVDGEVKMCISQAADLVGLKEIPNYEVEMGEEYDWVTKTQESFRPVEVADGLWIVPEWTSPPAAEAVNIILNPGLAFGTGEHPTTKLCLLLLRSLIKGGETFLDYGTGSGILAIAALKFGAACSVGVDIDPLAITSARHNAALNSIQPEKLQLHLVPGENTPLLSDHGQKDEEKSSSGVEVELRKEHFDVVVANILLNPLIELADHIVSHAKAGASVGISGILSEQLPDVIERYSQFLECISVSKMDDWVCVSGFKKANAIH